MKLNYYIADAFTKKTFNGVQIAVFPNADDLTVEQMQVLARELNLPETAFVSNPKDEVTHRRMRMFSPFKEIDFSSHTLVATAYILAKSKQVEVSNGLNGLQIEQNTGVIDVSISVENNEPMFVQFSRQSASVVDRFTPTEAELARILSIKATDIDQKKYAPRLVSCGLRI